jgi:hypothetical protein
MKHNLEKTAEQERIQAAETQNRIEAHEQRIKELEAAKQALSLKATH